MTDPAAHEARRAWEEWAQMCDAPSDAFSAGEWCEAANDLLVHLAASRAQLEQTREQFNWIKREAYGDNQAMRIIHACDVALDALAVIPDPEEAPT